MNSSFHRLRVALVASSLRLGGAEKQTVYIARTLFEAGVDLRFYYLGGGGHYEAVLRQIGVPVRPIHIRNHSWKMLAKLMRALRRFRPHVALVNQFGDLRFAGIPGRCCNALVLGGVRSDGWYELRSHGCLSRLMVRLTHGLIANSQHARQTLVSQGVGPQKIELLPNVIDLRDFDACSAQPLGISLSSDRIVVSAVGGLHACKRFDRFLEALALARRSEPALMGVIAGADLGAKAELQARAVALGFDAQDFRFIGECHNVPALLARSAMLILTSQYEGFPNVILEAMAARLPVITTPAGDAAVVVQHGATGFVVQPDDTQEMAAFMIKLARAPAMRIEFGEVGRKRVEQEYDYQSLTDRLLGIFRRFAGQQQRTALLELLDRGVPVNKTATPAAGVFAKSSAA